MPTQPVVRVIIVNYNAGYLLAACVGRVAASTVQVDIVVVDNASTDDSLARLRSMLPSPIRLSIHENAANLGFSRANNQALRDWEGEYALLLNPDCMIEPDTIEGMLAVMSKAPSAGMSGCLIHNSDGSEQAGCRRLTPTPGRALKRMFGSGDFDLAGTALPDSPVTVDAISGAFMLVRRAALAEVGLLDEDYFMHCEDLDWCYRFRQAGWQILFMPLLSVCHIKGACSTSNRFAVEWHKHRGMLRYYHKFFRASHPLLLLWLVSLAVWLRFCVKVLALCLRRS